MASTAAPVTTTAEPFKPAILYRHGTAAGDIAVTCAGDVIETYYCSTSKIDTSPVYFHGVKHSQVQVNTNGYVVFGATFNKRQPDDWSRLFEPRFNAIARREGLVVLATLWTDNNRFFADTVVSYQQYDKNLRFGNTDRTTVDAILAMANADAKEYSSFSQFDATWVLIVTWSNMYPAVNYRPQYDQGPNSFQLVLIADSLRKKTVYLSIYHETSWDSVLYERKSQIGYYCISQTAEVSFSSPYSNTLNAFKMDRLVSGIMGLNGVYGYTLSDISTTNYDNEQQCMDWYFAEIQFKDILDIIWMFTRACPCEQPALSDPIWALNTAESKRFGGRLCFYERVLNTNSATAVTSCCYDTGNGNGALRTATDMMSGNQFLFQPDQFQEDHRLNDQLPKEWCCIQSQHCDFYYHLRPIDTCALYDVPVLTWTFGDPHINTLDGLGYTFNGLGEYILIEIPGTQNFSLQGRTDYAFDGNGQQVNATIFSAFVARDADSDRFQVEMNSARDAFLMYIDVVDLTTWFYAAADGDSSTGDNMAVVRNSATHVSAVFRSGFTVSVTLAAGMLSLLVTMPTQVDYTDMTRGLLGVYNRDPTDDLTTPSGTVVPSTATEEVIFYDFGELWRIQSVDSSAFVYHAALSFYDYQALSLIPLFTTVQTDPPAAIVQQCSNDTACIYDILATGNQDIGLQTLAINQQNVELENDLANNRPVVTGDVTWNVTYGEVNTYVVSASDVDGDTVVISLFTSHPEQGLTFDETTGVLTWTPSCEDAIVINFQANDSRGAVSALFSPEIRFCVCSMNGNCSFGTLRTDQVESGHFKYAACMCGIGWSGLNCSIDYDACITYPCLIGVDCFDLTPEEQIAHNRGFNCSNCPVGYSPDSVDNECVDIDECNMTKPCDTGNGNCRNTVGSFVCSCNSYYRLNETTYQCEDINECAEAKSGCSQLCTNFEGGFMCDCLDGYALHGDNTTCVDVLNICDRANLTCTHGCDNSTGTPQCFCPEGYTLAFDDTTCEDIDECQTGADLCAQKCHNEVGSYNCSCQVGYILQPDQTSCIRCPDGTWGSDCQMICNCENVNTFCNASTGCTACTPGFVDGGECDVDINECDYDVCGPMATCNNTYGSFQCICPTGYILLNATNCVEIDECATDPCLNNGVCNDTLNNFLCTCDAGYSGITCAADVDECNSSPCQNNGQCQNRINKYRCDCVGDWEGTNCEIPILPITTTETPEITTEEPCVPRFVQSDIVYVYEVEFRIVGRSFTYDLKIVSSLPFMELTGIVKTAMDRTYGCNPRFDRILVDISDFQYNDANGQIDTRFLLTLAAQRNESEIVKAILDADDSFEFNFDYDFYTLSANPYNVADSLPSWAIVLIVLGALFIVTLISGCTIWALTKNRRRRRQRRQEPHKDYYERSSSGRSYDRSEDRPYQRDYATGGFYPGSRRGRVWMEGGDSLSSFNEEVNPYQANQTARLKRIARAVDRAPPVDWSVIQNFSQRNPETRIPDFSLHRGPAPYLPVPRTRRGMPSTALGATLYPGLQETYPKPASRDWSWHPNE